MPRSLVVTAMLAVFAVNLGILGYAMSIAGAAEAHGTAETDHATDAAIGTDLTGTGSRPPSEPTTIEDDELYDDEEEWAFEPIPVVNVFNVPGLDEIRPAYLHHCAGCHGIDGRGDGPAAEALLPRPRDFFTSQFRYASPGSDRPHVLVDIERTITRGVPRSAMPGFGGVLTEGEIAGLAHYVLDIREGGEELGLPADPIGIGDRPPITQELVDRGRELYATLSCNTCHGDSGRGDGMNAGGLVDFQGRPVRPADFTSGLFKTGQTPEDLCRTVLQGVPGTPMIAYEAVLAQENDDEEESVNTMDAWAVVAYIRSFARQSRPAGAASGAIIAADPAPDAAMPSDPAHPAWLGIEPVFVSVKPLQTRPELTTFIEVRAVRTSGRIAICIDWRDDTLDLARGEDVHSDAVAVMFGLGDEVPALLADVEPIDHGPVVPVNTWYWSADRQVDALTGRRHSQITLNTKTADDWYLFAPGQRRRMPDVELVNADPGADDHLAGYAVLELNAREVDGATRQPGDAQGTDGTAAWATGAWRVVMSRPLTTGDDLDVQFTPGQRIPVAFAVWNGAKGDHADIKLISSWHWLVPGPPPLAVSSGDEVR